MNTPNGVILFEGPSAIDGAPIVVIAVGLKKASSNSKTGGMIQTYILRSDISPIDAVHTGLDVSICGTCIHRGDGTGKARTCYVNLGQGVTVVYKAYKRGVYPHATDWSVFTGRDVRFGTYGDPAAAPLALWARLARLSRMHTGYIHRWRELPAIWASLFMASADTANDAADAHAMGYRTFRVVPAGLNWLEREVLCPASKEAGKKLQCADCGACNGVRTGRKSSIVIPLHGGTAVMANVKHLEARIIARQAA